MIQDGVVLHIRQKMGMANILFEIADINVVVV